MPSVIGKALHEGVRYETMRDLILGVREKYSSRDAFIFRRKPNEAEIHKTYHDFGNDVEYLAQAIKIHGYNGGHLGVVGENAYECNALSALMFVIVLALLMAINLRQIREQAKRNNVKCEM